MDTIQRENSLGASGAGFGETICHFCQAQRYHSKVIRQVPGDHIRVFGSVLHGTDRYDSDIDLLVDALPGATLFDLGGLQDELQELLGVHVDLLTPNDIPYQIRNSVVNEATAV